MLSRFFLGAAGVAAGAALICNISPWLVAKPQLASLDYLSAAKLQTLDGQKTNFSVSNDNKPICYCNMEVHSNLNSS